MTYLDALGTVIGVTIALAACVLLTVASPYFRLVILTALTILAAAAIAAIPIWLLT